MSSPPAYAMPSSSAPPQPRPNSSPALNHSFVAGPILTSLPTRASSRSAKAHPGNGASAGTDSGIQTYQSPLIGLPPLLVPPSSATSSTTTSTSSHFPFSPSASNQHSLTSGSSASSLSLLHADDTKQAGMKHYNSPVPGLPPLMMPAVAVREMEQERGLRPPKLQEKGLGEISPIIPILPSSPSLNMAYFGGSGTTHDDEDEDPTLTPSQSHSHSSLGAKTSTESSQTLVSVSSYASNHSSAARSGNSKVSAAPPPPLPGNHPLPPIPSAGGRGTTSSHLAHPTNGTGSAGMPGSHIVRSPSPLSPFSGHGEIQPYQSSPSSSSTSAQLQGLGLGPVHRSRNGEGTYSARSVSTPTPSLSTPGGGSISSPSRVRQPPPRVHVIASSSSSSGGPSRAIHRDLPPIVTAAAASDHPHRPAAGSQLPPRSVSLSSPRQPHYPASTNTSANATPSRKLPGPPALDLKQTSNNYRQFHSTQMLSPGMGMGMVSPGFSPTNVVVDSLIEEMHDDEEKEKDRSPANTAEGEDGPVRKTSILNRPRPRASSRSSSYRADPISRTPTPQQANFSPSVHDPTITFATQQQDITNPYYRPSIKLTDVVTHEGVQKALLPFLSIASFLALLTAFDKRWRRCISGEMVGKWIVREWALNLGPDVAWPGLGVWEGFLESLLHNSEAYPTYPTHLTSLLRHLSLSHTLIVLFLRSLPPTAFPTMPPFPFEDEPSISGLSHSVSNLSLFGGAAQRSRTASGVPGSEYGGGGPSRQPQLIPKAERVVELVMPEPLSAVKSDLGSEELLSSPTFSNGMTSRQHKRRSSVGSASLISWRSKDRRGSESSAAGEAFVMPRREGKKHSAPPPVSFPTAKRYVFKGFGDPVFSHSRKRNSLDGGGPGSIFSVDESSGGRSLYGDSSAGSTFPSRYGQMRQTRPFGDILGKSSMGSHHSPSSNSLARFAGSMLEDRTATSSPTFGRIRPSTPQPVEPAFQKPIPYVVGRAPILRVFVPLSEQVPDWPCAEGARRARHELERCGAWSKLRLGDVVINTALRDPLSSRHLMLFVPTVQPYLVPLEYKFSPEGHLPGYFDAFQVPPSYYYPLLPAPYIVSPDLSPWADSAVATIRLAFERTDIATSRGEKIVAKRYLHVCGFEISPQAGHLACDEWQGMVTLEAEGTAEGRASLLRRLGRAANESRIHAQRGPWEIIPEKSLGGTVWLRLI